MRNWIYYNIKSYIPKRFLLALRRAVAQQKRSRFRAIWPIYEKAAAAPRGWTGWPQGKKFALILTHDVETAQGQERCPELMQIEKRLGFCSSFNFTPERYAISPEVVRQIQTEGFEMGIHGLKHDGRLFQTRRIFNQRAPIINQYLKKYQAVGFRSPAMHHNLQWIHQLDIDYDASTTDTDPFEPQSCGVSSIFPFLVTDQAAQKSYVELPYTLAQDFSLFVLLGENNINVWKTKLDWIAARGGMALLNTHPDYMHMESGPAAFNEYPVEFYEELLTYLKNKYNGDYWQALPREMARFWRRTSEKINGKGAGGIFNAEFLCRSCRWALSNDSRPSEMIASRANYAPPKGNQSSINQIHKRQSPMNICMVAYTFYEQDNRVKRYAEALARRGDKVDVIALRQPGQSRCETVKGVNLYRIQKRILNEKTKLAYLYRLLRFLAASAVYLSARHGKNPYDVIHVHSVPDFEVFAAWLCKWTGAKVILDIHDLVPEFYACKFKVSRNSFFYQCLVLLEKAAIAFADHVIIANDLWQKVLISRSVREEKCKVFLNYPDQSIFFRRSNAKKNKKFIMMYPGTLNHHQGLEVALQALALIKEQAPQLEFHIYGDGPEKSDLVELTHELALEDRVFFKGFLPLEQIAATMAQADIGVVPKKKDSFGNEAFSTKILEFMSLGIPVVAADTKIDQFYFNDSQIQFFRSGDENDLARCLLLLIKNAPLRKRLARNGLKYVQNNSWDVHQERYFELLTELCSEKRY